MMIENTGMPRGSRRRRPTGNRFCSASSRHATSRFVGPHDEGTEQIEGGVDERRDKREGAGRQHGGDLAGEQRDVRDDINIDSAAGPASLLPAPHPLLLGQQLPDVAPHVLQAAAAALHVAVVVRVRVRVRIHRL